MEQKPHQNSTECSKLKMYTNSESHALESELFENLERDKDRRRESESGFSMAAAGDVWVRPHLIKDSFLHCFFSFFVCMGGQREGVCGRRKDRGRKVEWK